MRVKQLWLLTRSYAKSLRLVFRFGIIRTIRLVSDSIKQQIEIEFFVTPNRQELMGIKGDVTWELI